MITSIEPPALREALALTDFLLLTLDEAHHLVPGADFVEAAKALHSFGPSVVVVKVGARGCVVSDGQMTIHHPGFPIVPVDTVGAGDAFAAAFIAGYLRGGSWEECAALANAMGAATAAERGAGRRIPSADRLLTLLGDNPAARLLRP
jgi:2-dehydro-3-deoxygluconokinase